MSTTPIMKYIQNVKSERCVSIRKDENLGALFASKCNCNPLQLWKSQTGDVGSLSLAVVFFRVTKVPHSFLNSMWSTNSLHMDTWTNCGVNLVTVKLLETMTWQALHGKNGIFKNTQYAPFYRQIELHLNWINLIVNHQDGSYSFMVQFTKKCLREDSNGKIMQWICDSEDASQRFKIVENPCLGR